MAAVWRWRGLVIWGDIDESELVDGGEHERTDQLGVDECETDRIAFLVALWTLHRRSLDDALSDGTCILDVFELGSVDGGIDEFGATIDLEQLHEIIQSDRSDLSESFYAHDAFFCFSFPNSHAPQSLATFFRPRRLHRPRNSCTNRSLERTTHPAKLPADDIARRMVRPVHPRHKPS